MNIFEQTPPNRRRYGLAAFIGLIAGVVSAFVKWGAEVPLPPRSPVDMFNAACGPESLIRAAGQIDCSRNFLNPPYIFLRDWLGLTDPNSAVYTFAGHVFNWVGVTHIIFSIVFAVGYGVVPKLFPKLNFGRVTGRCFSATFGHKISFPPRGLTPPSLDLPWYEMSLKFLDHLVWFWSMEFIRRDLRNQNSP
uniref:YagU n=1 Tax=Escherichia coli TaxID=562 RepID=Q6YGS3_ECOLX|nr:YagU [Escherichia coli]